MAENKNEDLTISGYAVVFDQPTINGDVITKDTKFDIAPGLSGVQFKIDDKGVKVVTQCRLDEISIVPPGLGIGFK